ncbi:MAG: CPBP family intramembrane glutamic endopeptidase [Deltaproteobacteria bacterium]|nr:CPBP family intramembrane glutamic endopeptidase [Deltaproteobacteria bacterium]
MTSTVNPGGGSGNFVPRVSPLREGLVTFIATTAVAAALYWLGFVIPFVGQNLHGFIAVLFLYSPLLASRWSGLPFDHAREGGLSFNSPRRTLFTLLQAICVSWPVFIIGFFWFYGHACAATGASFAAWWWQTFAPICPRWLGNLHPPLRWPPDFILLALSQFLVVALPEELFFRGYLWTRIEARFASRWHWLGAKLGPAWLLSSFLFAAGHVAVDLDPRRFAVFFPALVFGWMRARSGSIVAGLSFHALCNLLSDVLYETYFR